jgi:cell division protein FtsA
MLLNNLSASSDDTAVTKSATTAPARKHRNGHRRKKSSTPRKERKERIFALDIGTRSVIGIVAEKNAHGLDIIATERQEHKTRAMLDGQIHDVPQVAAVINEVKKALAKRTGPLRHAAVAAAGRALYTMTAEAETEVSGIITAEQQRALDFAGVQAAQAKLGTTKTVDDLSRYYCVGYSTIKYTLDGNDLRLLIGQRGKIAKATVIATFLPRQVIDSMQSALSVCKLDMRALTLEPIAAINVLIPPTMRHLNLVLVDIGAGTSDVAITKNGSVIAYGMVPLAGDEITEAISQKWLLDFNVAEQVKRDAADNKELHFTDILGTDYVLKPEELITPILPSIKKLAAAIAKQIIELNHDTPQAVMLVGGGSLTPHLAEYVAEAMELPANRVAVRRPQEVDGIIDIPPELHSPDAVTPLGILKIASLNTLHFLAVYVNDAEYSLFNFRDLTVSDALLNAGISMKKYNGHPGLGLMVTLNGERKFFPGSLGTLAKLSLDGQPATLDTPVHNDSHIFIEAGTDGTTPDIHLKDIIADGPSSIIYVNGNEIKIQQQLLVGGKPAQPEQQLKDNDIIEAKEPDTVGEALAAASFSPTGRKLHYTLNGSPSHYLLSPDLLLNDAPAVLSTPFHEGDHIEYQEPSAPKLSDVLDLSELDTCLVIYFNDQEYKIPSASITLSVNGHPASTGTIIEDGCQVSYERSERKATTVSDALLAVKFQPPAASSRAKVTIYVNKKEADFADPIKNGDTLDIIIEKNAPAMDSPLRDSVSDPAPSSHGAPSITAPADKNKPLLSLHDLLRKD